MTDELTPEQEAAVRRLLSEARHDQPVPPEVAARLDEVLDGLVADEGVDDLEVFGSDQPASVTDLAGARRRRRNAGRLILAAAAVVIGGVAIGQSLGSSGLDAGGDDADSGDSALAEAPRDGTELAEPESQAQDDGAGGATAPESAPEPAEADLLDQVQAPLSLTSGNFAADVQRELRTTATARRKAARRRLRRCGRVHRGERATSSAPRVSTARAPRCRRTTTPRRPCWSCAARGPGSSAWTC